MAHPSQHAREIILLRSAIAAGSHDIPHVHLRLVEILRARGQQHEAARVALHAAQQCEASGHTFQTLVALHHALSADPNLPDAHALYARMRAQFNRRTVAQLDRIFARLTRGATTPPSSAPPHGTNVLSLLPHLARRRAHRP